MILAVSAGTDGSKKKKNPIRNHIRYLNYGLLGLATLINQYTDKEIKLFQGDGYEPKELFKVIASSGIDILKDCEYILLSIPSYYSISWCKDFCRIIKNEYALKIIVGGRWVVDNHTGWIRSKLNLFAEDIIVEGFGERALLKLFGVPETSLLVDGRKQCFSWLNYELLYEFEKYQPCIEISRGCGRRCQFCADGNNKRVLNKSVSNIMQELEQLDALYPEYSVYYEAPHFLFEDRWINDLCAGLLRRGKINPWRCTSRVETVKIEQLPMLREAGIRILDIGLESASHVQLVRMNKTQHPEKYLDQADLLLEACKKNDIWIKFNLLLYAGETFETVQETKKWLTERKDSIKDVSVSSLTYYFNMDAISDILELGASIPEGQDIHENGFVNLNLSPEIDYRTAQEIAVDIPKLIASHKDFFDVKKISYFENGYTYGQYLEDLNECSVGDLPFIIEEK